MRFIRCGRPNISDFSNTAAPNRTLHTDLPALGPAAVIADVISRSAEGSGGKRRRKRIIHRQRGRERRSKSGCRQRGIGKRTGFGNGVRGESGRLEYVVGQRLIVDSIAAANGGLAVAHHIVSETKAGGKILVIVVAEAARQTVGSHLHRLSE